MNLANIGDIEINRPGIQPLDALISYNDSRRLLLEQVASSPQYAQCHYNRTTSLICSSLQIVYEAIHLKEQITANEDLKQIEIKLNAVAIVAKELGDTHGYDKHFSSHRKCTNHFVNFFLNFELDSVHWNKWLSSIWMQLTAP